LKWQSLATIDGDQRNVSARATLKFSPHRRSRLSLTKAKCDGLSVFEVRGVHRGGMKPPRQANIWRCVLVNALKTTGNRGPRRREAIFAGSRRFGRRCSFQCDGWCDLFCHGPGVDEALREAVQQKNGFPGTGFDIGAE